MSFFGLAVLFELVVSTMWCVRLSGACCGSAPEEANRNRKRASDKRTRYGRKA